MKVVAELHYFPCSQLASNLHKLTIMAKTEQQKWWKTVHCQFSVISYPRVTQSCSIHS